MQGALPQFFVMVPSNEERAIQMLNHFYQIGGVLWDGSVDLSVTDYPYYLVQMRGTVGRPTMTPSYNSVDGEVMIPVSTFVDIDPINIITYELEYNKDNPDYELDETFKDMLEEDMSEWLELAEFVLS